MQFYGHLPLTVEQRNALIEELVNDACETLSTGDAYEWRESIVRNGFKGFANYTDRELVQAHVETFQREFDEPQ